MKREDLKKMLKPLVQECVREALYEGGLLSGIVSEVAKGMGTPTPQPQPSSKESNCLILSVATLSMAWMSLKAQLRLWPKPEDPHNTAHWPTKIPAIPV